MKNGGTAAHGGVSFAELLDELVLIELGLQDC